MGEGGGGSDTPFKTLKFGMSKEKKLMNLFPRSEKIKNICQQIWKWNNKMTRAQALNISVDGLECLKQG